MHSFYRASLLIAGLAIYAANSYAIGFEEDDLAAKGVNRGLNLQGMTGLLATTSAYTLKKNRIALSTGAIIESSASQSDRAKVLPLALAFGLTNAMEIGVDVAQFDTNNIGSGPSDVELHGKWRFKEQAADSAFAAAAAMSFIVPTAQDAFNEVNELGMRLHLMITSEVSRERGGYVGRYAELVLTANDFINTTAKSDNYGTINIGMLRPISDNNRLQFMLEGGSVFSRTTSYLGASNQTSFLLGLRYATPRLNATGAVQVLNKEGAPQGDITRMIFKAGFAL